MNDLEVAYLAVDDPNMSPDGTVVSYWSGNSITDKSGNVWKLNGPGTSVGSGILLNGVYCGQGANLLTIYSGLLWAQHAAGDWYTLVAPGIATPQPGAPNAPTPNSLILSYLSVGVETVTTILGNSSQVLKLTGKGIGSLIQSIPKIIGNSIRSLVVKGTSIGSNTVTTSPPVIISIKPDDGSVLSATTVPITVVAKDAVYGISKVEIRVDGLLKATDVSSPYKYSWKPTKGLHTIKITAYNAINKSATATYTVTIV